MGAWGVGNFENDTACDWGYELEQSDDLSFVNRTIQQILEDNGNYLDADLACKGLAAIETIVRLMGKQSEQSAYSEAVDNWVKTHPLNVDDDSKINAIKAIERILAHESELAELWEETDEYQDWIIAVTELKTMLET
ncbi:MAG: DUF4259 domain-containing protein [Methylococcaceae bacterium]|nr:DUF4259 domain-containing protein [Methylococcaceae bacterium]